MIARALLLHPAAAVIEDLVAGAIGAGVCYHTHPATHDPHGIGVGDGGIDCLAARVLSHRPAN